MSTEKGWRVAKAQGVFNLLGGLWPIVHLRSFEAIYGPRKRDVYLQMASAGQFAATGAGLLSTAKTHKSVRSARNLGVAAASTYLLIDLIYVRRGTIGKAYLIDAAMEVGWLLAWAGASRGD